MAIAQERGIVPIASSGSVVHFNEDTYLKSRPESCQLSEASGFSRKRKDAQSVDTAKKQETALQKLPTDDQMAGRSDEDAQDIISEAADVVYPLPENWPCIQQLFQRQSWHFSTAVSPSVNKATSHLELLQTIIEEWFQETVSRASSWATQIQVRATSRSSRATTSSKKRQMRFAGTPASRATGSAPAIPPLSVHGVGGQTEAESSRKHLEGSTAVAEDIPYLGAEEVITEVITMLARLEKDRQETLEALHKEREKVQMLGIKIDELAMKRAVDLPAAVQQEHEACAMDIAELNWHVSYKGRSEARMKQRVDVAEALNSKLKEDIEFVRRHVPLVEEKLELEKESMSKIKYAQADTDEELAVTLAHCNKVQDKSDEAHGKAAAERKLIKQDLNNARNYRQRLQDNAQELKILEVKNDNTKSSEAMAATKLQGLQAKLIEEEFKHRRLADEKSQLEEELNSTRCSCQHIKQELTLAVTHKEEQLRQLAFHNQELDMDVDDINKKISGCKKQKVADAKNLERMAQELERTEKQMDMTQEELARVSILNSTFQDQLRKEEEKCLHSEEALKGTTQALKKQIKEESHSRTVLLARISSDASTFENLKLELELKKEKLKKTADEVDAAVAKVRRMVDKLEATHEQRIKAAEELRAKSSTMATEKNNTAELQEHQAEELKPVYQALEEKLSQINKQLDHMDWKTEMMRKKMEDMDSSAKMMTRTITNTQAAIDSLQEELNELHLQLEAHTKLDDDTRASHSDVVSRMRQQHLSHKEHMAQRQSTLDQHKKDLTNNITLNKELASKYRRLQNEYVTLKDQVLNKYNDRVKVEDAIKDLKQVQGLQKRLHAALQEYYKLRGLYNQGELAHFEQESHHSTAKVGQLREEMDSTLDGFAGFLDRK